MSDFQVAAITALDQARMHINVHTEAALDQIAACRRAVDEIIAWVESVCAQRAAAFNACLRHPEADCSYEAQRLDAAHRVLAGVRTTAAHLDHALSLRTQQIEQARGAAVQWIARTQGHMEPVDGPHGAAVNSVFAAALGAATVAASVGAGRAEGGRGGGGLLPPGAERVRLSLVSVPPDLFETRPAKGGASKEDMVWAATTFRDRIVPHLAQGGTREGLEAIDQAEGNSGFRRLGGAYDVYLGSDIATVSMASDGRVTSVIGGEHRILAAQEAGLSWIAMRVHRARI